jgi:hypothetical protein
MTDIAAAYPHNAGAYEEASRIAARNRLGEASTEDLRKAFLNYRAFFNELIDDHVETYRKVS